MEKIIDDALYTASPEIVRRRYNPTVGFVLTAASIALLWANYNIAFFTRHELLAQWNLLLSSCMLCTGVVMICYWLFGDSSAPFDKQSRERLYRSEHSFEPQHLPRVQAAVESGQFSLLQQLPRSYQPTAQLICYRTDSGSMIAAQVVKNGEPAGEICIFRAGEYEF